LSSILVWFSALIIFRSAAVLPPQLGHTVSEMLAPPGESQIIFFLPFHPCTTRHESKYSSFVNVALFPFGGRGSVTQLLPWFGVLDGIFFPHPLVWLSGFCPHTPAVITLRPANVAAGDPVLFLGILLFCICIHGFNFPPPRLLSNANMEVLPLAFDFKFFVLLQNHLGPPCSFFPQLLFILVLVVSFSAPLHVPPTDREFPRRRFFAQGLNLCVHCARCNQFAPSLTSTATFPCPDVLLFFLLCRFPLYFALSPFLFPPPCPAAP